MAQTRSWLTAARALGGRRNLPSAPCDRRANQGKQVQRMSAPLALTWPEPPAPSCLGPSREAGLTDRPARS